MKYLALVIMWVAWCTLHSALISLSVTEWLRGRFRRFFRYYRILYNVVSVVTLVPILSYSYLLNGSVILNWAGPWRIVQLLLVLSALIFFTAGARRYDIFQFLGLRQVHDQDACSVITEDCSLDTRGILSIVRHPWYAGGILIVWARPLDLAAVLTNLVVCGYFVVGAMLEERKLKLQFGDEYAEYQKRVSMLFPIKWLTRLLIGDVPLIISF